MDKLGSLSEVKAYDKATKERDEQLTALEERGAEYEKLIEDYLSAEDHLVALERQHAALNDDRDGLRTEYSAALFENDFQRIEAVHNQREEFDNQLAKVFQGIEDVTAWLENNELDIAGMGEVIAGEAMLSQPSLYAVIEQLRAAHKRNTEDMQSRRVALSRSLYEYVEDSDVENAKRRLSDSYKANQEALEKRREQPS